MVEPLLSIVVYAGLITILVGLAALIVPFPRLRIPTRARALRVALAGLALTAISLLIPAVESRAAARHTAFDAVHPRWQFSEFHQTHVSAAPADVYRAIKDTTASEIALFQTLTAIRRLGQPGPENILNAPADLPILAVATRTGFHYLTDTPEEIVVATLVAARDPARIPKTKEEYIALDDQPGFAKATMNFRVTPEGTGTRLTTETRVLATDPGTRRVFAAYWRVIYPGSSLIRYAWLRAIRLRAETSAASPGSP